MLFGKGMSLTDKTTFYIRGLMSNVQRTWLSRSVNNFFHDGIASNRNQNVQMYFSNLPVSQSSIYWIEYYDLCHQILFAHNLKQECIPVGCVPSATVAVSWGSAWSGGCLVLGVPGLGGCLVRGCLVQGGVPACTEADPPMDRQTDVKT